MLEAMAARYTPQKLPRRSLDLAIEPFGNRRVNGAVPLFEPKDEEVVSTANDEALALALQQEELGPDEDEADEHLARALAQNRRDAETAQRSKMVPPSEPPHEESDNSLEEVSLAPSERSTPQSLVQERNPFEVIEIDDEDDLEEVTTSTKPARPSLSSKAQVTNHKAVRAVDAGLMEIKALSRKSAETPIRAKSAVPAAAPVPTQMDTTSSAQPIIVPKNDRSAVKPAVSPAVPPIDPSNAAHQTRQATSAPQRQVAQPEEFKAGVQPRTSKNSFDPVPCTAPLAQQALNPALSFPRATVSTASTSQISAPVPDTSTEVEEPELPGAAPLWSSEFRQPLPPLSRPQPTMHRNSTVSNGITSVSTTEQSDEEEEAVKESRPQAEATDDGDDGRSIAWSRSPSPAAVSRPPLHTEQSGETIPSEAEDEEADMAREDMVAEEDDYARFMAQIKNRDLNEVRTEIDDEIRVLNSQNKLAMRDSDEITQAMIAQIQVGPAESNLS